MREVYICDPEKNQSCKSYGKPGWCGIICFCTTKKEKSLTGEPLNAGEYAREKEDREMLRWQQARVAPVQPKEEP